MPRRPNPGLTKPKWSLYDLNFNQEHDLVTGYLMEITDIAGIEVDYFRRDESVPYDPLYGEHTNTAFEEPITTKVLYDVGEEPNLWSSFGMFGGDIITTHIPIGTWKRDISQTLTPMIGDVLHVKWLDREFEVVHVDDDDRIFQLKKMIYILVLRPYRFSEQSASATEVYTETLPMSAYGDNDWIETQSDAIDAYTDIDDSIYLR